MPTETVTLVLDKSQYERAISEVVAGQGRLSRSGEQIGQGFVRGERAVTRATGRITGQLLQVQSAGDAAGIALQGLERIFKIGLVPGVVAAAAIGGFVFFQKKVEESEIAYQSLRRELSKPIGAEINLSPDDLVERIDTVRKATDAADKSAKSWAAQLGRVALDPAVLAQLAQLFLPSKIPGFLLPTSKAATTADVNKEAIAGRERLLKLEEALGDAELKRANLQLIDNELTKAEVVYEQKRAKLVEDAISKGGDVLSVYKRLLALQVDLEVAGRKKAESDKKSLDAAKAATAEAVKQAALLREPPKTPEQKKQEAIQEADKNVADAQAAQGAIEAQQAEEDRAAAQKKKDISEVQRFGRVLDPQERMSVGLQDEEDARQKKFQFDEQERQQNLKDQMEGQLRGITPEQLKNERDFNKSRGKDGVSALADQDFSGIASLANQDFSGIASLGGLSIKIV